MRKILVFSCIVLIAGAASLAGCLSNDDKFGNTIAEMGDLTQPEMTGLNESIAIHDFNDSKYHCNRLIGIEDTYLPRLVAINVSAKYQRPTQYMITGFEKQRKGCQVLINSTEDDLGTSMAYFSESANDFQRALDSWPD